MTKPHDLPIEVAAENGEVILDGLDGLAISLTPQAAAETSDRLHQLAAEARGQALASEIARRGPRSIESSTKD
jgi:hypothetical protein